MAQFVAVDVGFGATLYLQFFCFVKNSDALLQNFKRFDCCFIDPSCIISVTQVLQAAHRALFELHRKNRSKTGNLYSDLAYYLTPEPDVISIKIEKALSQVLVNEKTKSVLVATFEIEVLETTKSAIDGNQTDISDLPTSMNIKKIREIFEIIETNSNPLPFQVYSSLSLKGFDYYS
jgi:hypothetical protein